MTRYLTACLMMVPLLIAARCDQENTATQMDVENARDESLEKARPDVEPIRDRVKPEMLDPVTQATVLVQQACQRLSDRGLARYEMDARECRCEDEDTQFWIQPTHSLDQWNGRCDRIQRERFGALPSFNFLNANASFYATNESTRDELECQLDRLDFVPPLSAPYTRSSNAKQWQAVVVGRGPFPSHKSETLGTPILVQLMEQLSLDRRPPELIKSNEAVIETELLVEPEPELLALSMARRSGEPDARMIDAHVDPKVLMDDIENLSRYFPEALSGFDPLLVWQSMTLKSTASSDRLNARVQAVHQAYLGFLALSRRSWIPTAVAAPSRYGCAEICDLSLEYSTDNAEVTHTKRYVRGAVAHERLTLRDPKTGGIFAVVLLNPQWGISLTLLNFVMQSPSGDALYHVTELFDREWRAVGLLEGSRRELKTPSTPRPSARAAKKDSAILLCDTPSVKRFTTERMIVGPHGEPTIEAENGWVTKITGSIGGWFRNTEGNLQLGLSGIAQMLPEVGAFYQDANNRSELVLAAAVDIEPTIKAAIIPDSICFSRYNDWKDTIFERGVRVANASFNLFIDANQCEKLVKPVEEDPKFLWVVGAGQTGKSAPPRLSCPQNLPARPDRIVVAAVGK